MAISEETFREQFEEYKKLVLQKSGSPFVSFQEGLPAQWEEYKPALRARALEILDPDSWRETEIGGGRLLTATIAAIELDEPGLRNNLVRWENRWGHSARAHKRLLDATVEASLRSPMERALYEVFVGDAVDADAFDGLLTLAGKRYDLLAYLFYLRDDEKFMPIATTTFDRAFRRLGVDLVTANHCSWENYAEYNATLMEVRSHLEEATGSKVRLIDAHSFCWKLIRLPDVRPQNNASSSKKPKKDPGKVYNPRERSAWAMAAMAEKTATQSDAGVVEKKLKKKELRMSRGQLEKYVLVLLEKQENRCALTGLHLQWEGESNDAELLASLDRIDSDGHYEVDNLQVVCRFVNRWKGADPDEEFRRLLDLVRGSS